MFIALCKYKSRGVTDYLGLRESSDTKVAVMDTQDCSTELVSISDLINSDLSIKNCDITKNNIFTIK